jgi:putative heme-binding domain-containing protein
MRWNLLSLVKPALAVGCLLTVATLATAADDPFAALVRTTEPLTAEDELKQLKVPEGFKVELVAAEPLINKPINLAFDERGRLWVSSTVEYPFAAEKDRWVDAEGSRVRDSRDAIKILSDTDGDGRMDKAVDFADGLNIPIGVLPYGKGCIAWSIPNIWYFEDTDGDDRCDKRTVLFGPLGYDRDVHGNIASLRLRPDGWVYATHGFNNQSRFEVKPERLNGRKLGDPRTVLEVQSGNTFRFRPDGSAIELWAHGQVNPFGMCFDAWGQMFTADCHSDPVQQVLRGAYYPSFGKPHDGLGFAPQMCPHRHGSTGLCGVEIVDRGIWGPDWDGHLFIGNCVTSRVNHDLVQYTGATAKAIEQPDFVTSGDPWFRPVDLRLGPDGALYIADFYNRIIGHYEVDRKHPGRDRERGRIWRVVRTADGGPKKPAPLTKTQEAIEVVEYFQPDKVDETNHRLGEALSYLITEEGADARGVRKILEQMAAMPEAEEVRSLSRGAFLAAFGAETGQPAHTVLLRRTDDPALRHSLRLAIRNGLRTEAGFEEWKQIELPPAAANDVASIFRSLDGPERAEWLLDYLIRGKKLPPDAGGVLTGLARKLPTANEGRLIAYARGHVSRAEDAVSLVASLREGITARGGKPSSDLAGWAAAVAGERLDAAEKNNDTGVASKALVDGATLSRSFQLADARPRLAAQLKRADLSDEARIAAAEAIADDPQWNQAAVDLLKSAPWRIQTKLAEAMAGSKAAAAQLVEAAPPRLLTVPSVAQKLNAVGDATLKARIAERTKNLPSASDELIPVINARRKAFERLRDGNSIDAEAGKVVFTKNCSACHQLAGIGKQVGPQLEGLKARGAERLCEDLLDPNRAVDPNFRRHLFTMADGTATSGLIRRDEGGALVIVDPEGREKTLVKADIDQREETGLSLMPTGYDKLLTEEEFCNLLAWLLQR